MKSILEVHQLKKHYPIRKGLLKRVTADKVKSLDGVSFQIGEGETFAVVGESGCGKTTLGKTLLRLIEPTEGEVRFDGINVTKLTSAEWRAVIPNMQIVFQDPYASLDPKWTVRKTLEEPLLTHRKWTAEERARRIGEMLEVVGLMPYYAERYPHELSGGQRQRIAIARALMLNPKFVVFDEPVSALDVSIQSQILNLMQDLQDQFGLTFLFISHDLSVVKYISNRVGVMYLGKMVEIAPTADLFEQPLHPYTQALLSAIPVPDPEARPERIVLAGDVPSPHRQPSGCAFHTRCPKAVDACRSIVPELREVADGRQVACLLYNDRNEG